MGEYWKPVNLDKRQQVHPHYVDDGLKWREWVSDETGVIDERPRDSATRRTVLRLLTEGVWSSSDEIRIVSDYGGSVPWFGPITSRPAEYDDDWVDAHELSAHSERPADGMQNQPDEADRQADYDDDDPYDECTHCRGTGWDYECDHEGCYCLEGHQCGACGGSGLAEDQRIW